MNNNPPSLLDRYIYAVKQRLPCAKRDDIAAELHEILRSQVDDEEARLQRPLTDAEIEQILKKYGAPRNVAASYGSYRYLIGPEIFPSYLVAVRIVLWVLAPITLFMLLMSAVLAEENFAENLAETFWTMLSIGLFNLVAVTLVFAWLGRVRSGTSEEDWDLDELPEAVPGLASAPQPAKRSEAVGSLAGLVLLTCWWLGVNRVLALWFDWDMPFAWTEVWTQVGVLAIAVLAASIARELMGLLRPLWTRAYVAAGVVLDLLALPVLFRLLEAGTLVAVKESAASDGPSRMLVFMFDKFIFVGVILITVIAVVNAVSGAVRLVRMGWRTGNQGIGSAGQPDSRTLDRYI
jgi:hypothetical protein